MSSLSASKIAGIVTGKNFDGIDPAILEEARLRGNAIHSDVESGEFKTPEGEWVKKQIGDRRYISENQCHLHLESGTVTGKYDLKFLDGFEIVDFKTQAAPDIRFWAVQLNIYKMIDGINAEKLTVYHLPKSGNFAKISVPILPEEKINQILNCAFKNELLPNDFWDFIEKSTAQEINLDLIVYEHDIGKIVTNVDEIVEQVKQRVASYVPENYSPDNIAIAKKDKAALNNSAKLLNDKRIQLERKHMEKIVEITEKINFAKKLIETASGKIDTIVKDVEAREKEEIKKDLIDYFNSLSFNLVTFAQIFSSSMLNKTAKRNETKKAILDKVEKIKSDLAILDRIECPEAKVYYLNNLDLDYALREADRIKENQRKLKEANEAIANPVIPEPIQDKNSVVINLTEKMNESPFDVIEETKNREEQKVKEVCPVRLDQENLLIRQFQVKGTEAQLIALSEYMNSNGIEWEKI